MSGMSTRTSTPSTMTEWWRRPVTWVLALVGLTTIALGSTAPIIGRWLDDPANAEPVATAMVGVVDDAFEPSAVAVPTGSTVTWEWAGQEEHNVVLDEGPSSPLQVSGEWQQTFDEAGEYLYRCTIHPFMDGRVVAVDDTSAG